MAMQYGKLLTERIILTTTHVFCTKIILVIEFIIKQIIHLPPHFWQIDHAQTNMICK